MKNAKFFILSDTVFEAFYNTLNIYIPVSYTHLDVYKRQG